MNLDSHTTSSFSLIVSFFLSFFQVAPFGKLSLCLHLTWVWCRKSVQDISGKSNEWLHNFLKNYVFLYHYYQMLVDKFHVSLFVSKFKIKVCGMQLIFYIKVNCFCAARTELLWSAWMEVSCHATTVTVGKIHRGQQRSLFSIKTNNKQ